MKKAAMHSKTMAKMFNTSAGRPVHLKGSQTRWPIIVISG